MLRTGSNLEAERPARHSDSTLLFFDQALHLLFCRLIEAKKNALYSPELGSLTTPDRPTLEPRDTFVQTGCAAHSGFGTMKWGPARWGDKAVHDLFIFVMRSLRQTFDAFFCHLRPWLMQNAMCDQVIDPETEARWWRLLGVDTDWIAEFVEVALRWREGLLHIASELGTDKDRFENISRCGSGLCDGVPFALLVGVLWGPSCRQVVAEVLGPGLAGVDGGNRCRRQCR